MSQIAKLFINGRSQAVRLPAEYRFKGKEIFIRRDQKTGDVILSKKPQTWDDFFSVLKNAHAPSDFLSKHSRNQDSEKRDPFEGWEE